ncbi:RNA-binding protein 25, partial [Ophiophagus hannah]
MLVLPSIPFPASSSLSHQAALISFSQVSSSKSSLAYEETPWAFTVAFALPLHQQIKESPPRSSKSYWYPPDLRGFAMKEDRKEGNEREREREDRKERRKEGNERDRRQEGGKEMKETDRNKTGREGGETEDRKGGREEGRK